MSVLPRAIRPAQFRLCGFIGLGRERSGTTAPVQQLRLLPVIALETNGEIEKRAVQQCPVIIGDGDEPSLLYKPAQLDQMSRAFSSGHDPFSRVEPRPCRIKPVPSLFQLPCRLHRRH